MYIIPFIRTSRAITACTILPSNPIIAISVSEIISYIYPFIENSPLKAFDDMVLFLFYYYSYNSNAIDIINKFKEKNLIKYKIESISIITYLIIYIFLNN